MGRKVVVIGAGPAGLTAAWELVSRSDFEVTVLEKSAEIGGLSRTVVHNGNRIDIGGHRFFSKSDRVMRWWLQMLPQATDPEREERVFLLRQRRSRIYYLRQLFRYPITLSLETVRKLGLLRTLRIGMSYLRSAIVPVRPERNLEDFFINRFGRELYRTFFKSYTEKVWGVPCDRISPEWGGQRVKGLSVLRALTQALTRPFRGRDLGQKGTETSLIEQFLYPKHGPGQMWQEVTRRVCGRGGQVLMERPVVRLELREGRIAAVLARAQDGGIERHVADHVLSSMPVQELVAALDGEVPANVREVAAGLVYRDFITVGLLLSDFRLKEDTEEGRRLIRDNWIYIQEEDVQVGRLQIFNNWSPYLVADRAKVWVGLEYFCNEGDPLWRLPDAEMLALATSELAKLGMIEKAAVEDGVVIRQPKAYPAYFGSYTRFSEVARFLDGIPNLFPVGRNGMHKYNNQDHSMLTAMVTVDAILAGSGDKTRVWAVNTEEDYHEERASS